MIKNQNPYNLNKNFQMKIYSLIKVYFLYQIIVIQKKFIIKKIN